MCPILFYFYKNVSRNDNCQELFDVLFFIESSVPKVLLGNCPEV